MLLILFGRFSLEKCGKIWKYRPFFRANMVGFGSIGLKGHNTQHSGHSSHIFSKLING